MAVMAVAFVWLKYFPYRFAYDPWNLVFFPGDSAPWSVTTAVFMHGGWFHLLGNLLYLHVLGPPLEDRLGRLRFGLYFLVLGNFGNLVHGLVSALGLLDQRGLGVMGASGAIAGLLGFSLVRLYDARVQVAWWVLAPLMGQNRAGRSPVPLVVAVLVWVVLQIVHAALATETGSRVSFGAHLGGFAMGLGLALVLGELKRGRAEAARARARRYFRAGHFHAAAGAWSEYIEQVPEDADARIELARTLQVAGQAGAAAAIFGRQHRRLMRSGDVARALELYDEAVRRELDLALGAQELSQVAIFKEKQLDYEGALAVYRRLYETYPRHPQGQRALVRVIVLCHGKVGDPDAARTWLDEAARRLPPGSWRDFLAREFNLPTAIGAAPGPGPG
jgi:membrane associated rhomboid family serine protease